MDTSIVIRARNEEKHLGRLLATLKEQVYPRQYEVILVDSGSTDRTIRIAEEHWVDQIVLIAPEDFSFGASINRGCEAAKGDKIALISAHCYPESVDWLARLTEPLADSGVSMAFGRQRGLSSASCWSEIRLLKKLFPDNGKVIPDPIFCNNANSAFRKSLWERMPFDESVSGLEDIEWARRVRGRGMSTRYVPGASVIHIHEETPRQVFRRFEREAVTLKSMGLAGATSLSALCLDVVRDICLDLRSARSFPHLLKILPSAVAFQICRHAGHRSGCLYEAASLDGAEKAVAVDVSD